MKNRLELNSHILKEKFPRIFNLIGSKMPDDFEAISTRSGMVTCRYKSILLHSQFDPVKEGEKFAQSTGAEKNDYLLLYGLGLGYHLKPLLDIIGPSGKLLIIELNREIISAAFTLIDFSELLSNPNLDILFGDNDKEISECLQDVFSKEWRDHPKEKCKTIIHPASFKCMPSAFKKFQNSLEMQIIENRAKIVWSEVEKHNYQLNREYVNNGKGVKELAEKYKGKPAFLISAGPSLNRALPLLNRLSDNIALIAVDTSLPVLMQANIMPHFILSVDPQDLSFCHVSNYLDKNIAIILTPTSNPKTVRQYSGEKYFAIQRESDIDEREINRLIMEKGETRGGGSVSCIALDIMVQMGFDPIIFIGQDCSFPGARVYAENSFLDRIWIDSLNGSNNIETLSSDSIKEKKEVIIENKFGGNIPTHQHLYIYLRYLEQIVGKYSNVTFFNLLSMGAKIEGVKDIDSIKEISLNLN